MPDIFQGALPVPAEPPFAETYLKKECEYSYEQTYSVSAVWRKVQPEREIYKRPDDRLGDVVRQAHPSVKAEVTGHPAESPVPVQDDER